VELATRTVLATSADPTISDTRKKMYESGALKAWGKSEKLGVGHAGVAQLQHVAEAEAAEKLQGSAKSGKERNKICAIKHTKRITQKEALLYHFFGFLF